jgi:hypothetical protein
MKPIRAIEKNEGSGRGPPGNGSCVVVVYAKYGPPMHCSAPNCRTRNSVAIFIPPR